MGEAKLKRKTGRRSATQKLIAEFPQCCFCGGARPSATREHMPPISLFDAGHRPDGLVMPACHECNKGTSTADLAVALISRWNAVSTPQGASGPCQIRQTGFRPSTIAARGMAEYC